MTLSTLILPLLLQVGPNPSGGAIPDVPDELANRPAREAPAAITANKSPWLIDCLEMLEEDAARAHSQAQIRRTETAGTDRVLANHCLGLAATRLGRWSEAQSAFTAARDETPANEAAMRARFGAMAGNAALGGNDADSALALLAAARVDAVSGNARELLGLIALDRGRALVQLDRMEDATAELIAARDARPDDAEIRLLLATLLRRTGNLGPAQSEIEAAATLAPGMAEVALEAGVIAVLGGREAAARQSWQSAIDLAPGTETAATASSYIGQLDATPES
ncbi:tetratricopeptide repeat protein [Altererythrobacter arenosus]|uniref:Tetratricopeptide repeat protein n=1 Tax=Altererythrobacter arenosus TaxID=3032592 RepID=A0ABY8FU31_9SPHN|nr:tetratricopeptide repeat protein [Altererythrobacter sp. CAU 1644]WFL78521.1 tetratricopeptide repeat protein [Altererythrobacter sp. CAU 1644]